MANEERSVRDEMNHALVESAKRIILEKVDEETLRRYLLEETANELHRLLQGWELRGTIEQAVKQRLGQRIPEAKAFGQGVGLILEKHFPEGTKISVQTVEARTVRELTKKS